jgi:predicted pyridoxine 5'-phosphate oxidase superfamily flavin-nucleotide-binding protein
VHTVYFQCSRALLRSKLWDPATQVPRTALPSVGRILSDLTAGTFDGVTYDRELPARVASTLY